MSVHIPVIRQLDSAIIKRATGWSGVDSQRGSVLGCHVEDQFDG